MNKYDKKRTMIYSNVKENKRKANEISKIKEEQINLDNEVVIGLNKSSKDKAPKIEKKVKNKKNDKIKENNQQGKKQKMSINSTQERRKSYNDKYNKKKKKIIIKLLLNIIFGVALIIGFIFFFRLPIFNISEINIKIQNNNVLTESTIKELSEINLGQNLFSIHKNKTIKKIKENPYIENVKIKKNIPNNIEIIIEERHVKFQLQDEENQYIHIDNQGYILEKSSERKDNIIITGYSTTDLTQGKRLNVEDLEKLSTVLQIIQELSNNNINDKISNINIQDSNNYKIYFDEVGKTVHLGDMSSINDKMAYLKKILEVEENYEGEIFLNVNLNNGEYPYFREKI